jgi:hypothetical protein
MRHLVIALLFSACAPGMRVTAISPPRPPETQPFTVDVEVDNAGDSQLVGTLEGNVAGQPLTPEGSAAVDLPKKQRQTVRFRGDGLPRGNYRVDIVLRVPGGAVRLSANHPLEIDAATRLARYNEVYQTASHNSYWVKRDNVVEVHAGGPRSGSSTSWASTTSAPSSSTSTRRARATGRSTTTSR